MTAPATAAAKRMLRLVRANARQMTAIGTIYVAGADAAGLALLPTSSTTRHRSAASTKPLNEALSRSPVAVQCFCPVTRARLGRWLTARFLSLLCSTSTCPVPVATAVTSNATRRVSGRPERFLYATFSILPTASQSKCPPEGSQSG